MGGVVGGPRGDFFMLWPALARVGWWSGVDSPDSATGKGWGGGLTDSPPHPILGLAAALRAVLHDGSGALYFTYSTFKL